MDTAFQGELTVCIMSHYEQNKMCHFLLQGLEQEGLFDSSCLIHKYDCEPQCEGAGLKYGVLLCIVVYTHMHRWCMVFAFLPVLKKELDEFVLLWNTHHIRPTRLVACPSGRPDDIYELPELFGDMYSWS